MLKPQKIEFVKDLASTIKGAPSVVLINYTGMNVATKKELADRLREVGATMQVSKNTLFKIAAKDAGLNDMADEERELVGQTAVIVSDEDPIAPLQILGKFNKEFDLGEFKFGVVEGDFQDGQALVTLSKLPAREVLLAQAIGAIAAPLYGFVSTLNAPMQKLVHVLDEASKKE